MMNMMKTENGKNKHWKSEEFSSMECKTKKKEILFRKKIWITQKTKEE